MLGISEATFHRWRKWHGGRREGPKGRGRSNGNKYDLTRRLRELDKENRRLKQLVGELTLANAMIKDTLEERD